MSTILASTEFGYPNSIILRDTPNTPYERNDHMQFFTHLLAFMLGSTFGVMTLAFIQVSTSKDIEYESKEK